MTLRMTPVAPGGGGRRPGELLRGSERRDTDLSQERGPGGRALLILLMVTRNSGDIDEYHIVMRTPELELKD